MRGKGEVTLMKFDWTQSSSFQYDSWQLFDGQPYPAHLPVGTQECEKLCFNYWSFVQSLYFLENVKIGGGERERESHIIYTHKQKIPKDSWGSLHFPCTTSPHYVLFLSSRQPPFSSSFSSSHSPTNFSFASPNNLQIYLFTSFRYRLDPFSSPLFHFILPKTLWGRWGWESMAGLGSQQASMVE